MTSRSPYWHPFASMGDATTERITVVRGSGSTIWDDEGNSYLDAMGSLWYCNVGHGRTELADAARAQMIELAAYQTFEVWTSRPVAELADKLQSIAPLAGAKIFFTSGGSESVDTAAKLARAYWAELGKPERNVIISRQYAYHGVNAYGTSLGGIPANSQGYDPLVSLVEHVPWNDAVALRDTIERLGADRVCAFFCEPVMGAGGIYFPPPDYLSAVRNICAEHGVLFVADEVITGFGRAGAWFGCERYGLEPDIITGAKGITSGYVPLGTVIVGERVAEPFWREGSSAVFRHGYTYSGHTTACAVALANLRIVEREALIERVRALELVLASELRSLADHPLVAEVRVGHGLLGGVELAPEALAERPGLGGLVAAEARAVGLATRALRGAVMQFSPPFVITEDEIRRAAELLREALDAAVPAV